MKCWYCVVACVCVSLLFTPGALFAAGTKIRETGTIASISRGMLQVNLKSQGKVSVPITDKTDIHVRGDFGLNMVKPGMFLNFSGMLKDGAVEEEITEANMFTLADGFKPGVAKITDDAPQSISGQVKSISGQTVTLDAGRKVTVTFAKNIKISIDTKDYSVAGPGNAVELRGTLNGKQVTPSMVIIKIGPVGGDTATKNVVK